MFKSRLSLICFSCLLLFPLVWVFGTGIMEARNFISAQTMFHTGDWLVPHLFTELRLNKPPLPTWITAFVYFINPKPSMWLLHLPVILVTSALSICCYEICKILTNSKQLAFLSGLIIASCLLTLKLGTTNSWDIYSVVFMTGGLWAILKNDSRKIYYILGIIFVAMSFMSKGPIQLYTMFLPFMLASWLTKTNISFKKALTIIILGVAVGSLWYLYIYFHIQTEALQIIKKETTDWSTKHTHPFWFYLSFPGFLGAWAIFGLLSLFQYKKIVKSEIVDPKYYKFLFLWFIFSIILLSIVPEKKERYLMPAFIPLALLTAVYIQYLLKRLHEQIITKFELITLKTHITLLTLTSLAFNIIIIICTPELIWWYSLPLIALTALIGYYGFKNISYFVLTTCLLILCTILGVFRFGLEAPIKQNHIANSNLAFIRTSPIFKKFQFYSLEQLNPIAKWELNRDISQIYQNTTINKTFVLVDENKNHTNVQNFINKTYPNSFTKIIQVQTSAATYKTLFLIKLP